MLEERLNPKPENFKRKTEGTEKTEVKSKVKKVQRKIKDFFKGNFIQSDKENHQLEETVDEVGEDLAAGYVGVSGNTQNDGSSTDIRENKNNFDSGKSENLENQKIEGEPALTKKDSQENDLDIGSGNNEADRENNPIMEDGENIKIDNKNNEGEILESKNMEVESKSNEDDVEDTKIMEKKSKADIEKNKITENQNNGVEHVLAKEDSHESDMDVESANGKGDGDNKTKDNEEIEIDKANNEFGENKTTKNDGDKETTENKNSENDYTQAKSDFQEANMEVDKTSNSQENSEQEPMSQTPSEEL